MYVYVDLTERWLIRTDLESVAEGVVGRPICKVDVCACIIERREVQRGQVEQMVS